MLMRIQDFPSFRWSRPHSKTHFPPKTHNPVQITRKCNQIDQQVEVISVNNEKLQHQLAIYDWRCKTQFPIVKIQHCKVIESKANSTVLQIKRQKSGLKLKSCKQLPLFKVLYLLKQSLIGFQRLYNKFGPFLVTPKMITINSSQKCKVWLNQNYASNSLNSVKINESTFLLEVYRLFQQVSNNLKNTCLFYQQLHHCKTFCEALSLIQCFSVENKIVISSSCKLTSKEMVFEETQQHLDFNASLSINKKPNFLPLSGLRISLNTTAENPFKKVRSPTNFKEQGAGKRQLSNIIQNKKTEDTAREGSHVNTISNKEDLQGNYLNCLQNKPENKDFIYKSQLPVNVNSPEKNKFCVRKCNSHTTGIQEYEKFHAKVGLPSKQFDTHAKIKTKDEPKIYDTINDEEDEQKTRHNIQNTFEKNQWNKTLNGLWQEQVGLTHSIVNTQQKVKGKVTPIQLQLLGKISLKVYQSFINSQTKYIYENQPHTSEF